MTDQAPIELRLPPEREYLRLTRLIAGGLVGDQGDLDDLDDLRLAITELATALIDVDETSDEPLVLLFHPTPTGLRVEGRRAIDGEPPTLDDLTQAILDATLDHHRISADGDAVTFELARSFPADVGS